MGAKAEHSLVFHVVGMPSYQQRKAERFEAEENGEVVTPD
jgi:hypothetical protein